MLVLPQKGVFKNNQQKFVKFVELVELPFILEHMTRNPELKCNVSDTA